MAEAMDLFGAQEQKPATACFVSGCVKHGSWGYAPRGSRSVKRRYCDEHRAEGEAYWASLHQR